MPLRNRVDPFKQIKAVPQRGAWFGNRGLLHDAKGDLRRLWHGDRWIICELEFKGRKRELVQPGKYTELFFLDEATAFAAGHRPCKECRRDAAILFQQMAGFSSLKELDAAMHPDRIVSRETPLPGDWQDLPDGAMIGWLATAYLVYQKGLYRWSFDGYRRVESIKQDIESSGLLEEPWFKQNKTRFEDHPVFLLTPPITMKVLEKGYPVQIHPSAG